MGHNIQHKHGNGQTAWLRRDVVYEVESVRNEGARGRTGPNARSIVREQDATPVRIGQWPTL